MYIAAAAYCGIEFIFFAFQVYGNKVAVKDTTLKMFEGQITSLLGHNGAGKVWDCGLLVVADMFYDYELSPRSTCA